MKCLQTAIVALPLLLSGCMGVSLVPPADVPAAPIQVPQSNERSDWRPYSSGPMQSSSSRRASENWAAGGRKDQAVTRTAIPEVTHSDRPSESVDTSAVARHEPPSVSLSSSAAVSASAPSGDWSAFKRGRTGPAAGSVFGTGVNSAWATDYVPESHRTEFGIFAQKAAKDGQARMTMPTGEVYSASVTRRNGACTTVEVGVTADGDLPVVSRGLVQVCR